MLFNAKWESTSEKRFVKTCLSKKVFLQKWQIYLLKETTPQVKDPAVTV